MNNQFSFKRAGIKMPKHSNKLYRKNKFNKIKKMDLIPENDIIKENKNKLTTNKNNYENNYENIINYKLTNTEKDLINQYWPDTYTSKSLASILKSKENFYNLNKNWFEFIKNSK